jgi:ComF family protein
MIFGYFIQTGTGLLNLLFPNSCSFCARRLDSGVCVCEECLKELEVVNDPACERCGAPDLELHSEYPHRASCPHCEDLYFGFHTNKSLGIYTGRLRELIQLYKFQKRRLLFRTFVELLVAHRERYILEHDLLLPMPLSRSRYSERGFNQCQLIAQGIAKTLGIPFFGDILQREGHARPQSSLRSREARMANMTDRFRVRGKWQPHIEGRNALLFDDVMTTGATASRCAEALYGAGAENVDLLTLGRSLIGVAPVEF